MIGYDTEDKCYCLEVCPVAVLHPQHAATQQLERKQLERKSSRARAETQQLERKLYVTCTRAGHV